MRKVEARALSQQQARKIHRLLQKTIRQMGYGSVGRVETAFSKKRGWLRERRRRNRIELSILLELLAMLEIDAGGFFQEALSERTGVGWRPPSGKRHEAVERALGRIGKVPCPVSPRSRQKNPESERGREAGEALDRLIVLCGEAVLDRLDALRFEEPREVLALGSVAVDRVPVEELPRLLGILGSAHRIRGELDEAALALDAGLEILEAVKGDARTLGDLQIRLSYVVADRGSHGEAVTLAEKALVAFCRSGDRARAARALIAIGSFEAMLGSLDSARRSFESALAWLPAEESRRKCAAFHGLAELARVRGDRASALRWLERVREHSADLSRLERGKIAWLEGRLRAGSGSLESAERKLREAADLLQTSPLDAALVAVSRVRVTLQAGDPHEAGSIAQSMARYLAPFEENVLVSAALREIVLCGLEGRLTLRMIARVQRALESERERKGSRPFQLIVTG